MNSRRFPMSQRKAAWLTALLTLACANCLREKPSQPADNASTPTLTAKDYYERALSAADDYDPDAAIAELNQALQLDPHYVDAYVERGYAWWKKSDFDAALKDEDKALELDPRKASAYVLRGMAKTGKGDLHAAIQDYDKAIEIDPNNANAYRNRASDRLKLADDRGAEADYRKTLQVDPQYAYAYVGLGIIKQKRGDFARAIADYWKATEVDAGLYEAYNALAWIFSTCPKKEFRDGKRAVEVGLEAAKLTKYRQPYVLGTLGAAYAELGNFAEAIKYQEQALTFAAYNQLEGDKGRHRLQLYQNGKPYRDRNPD